MLILISQSPPSKLSLSKKPASLQMFQTEEKERSSQDIGEKKMFESS